MATVAIADSFMKAFGSLPKTIQKKTAHFLTKLRADPQATGRNYEKLRTSDDRKVYSARVDQAYRAIIVHPDNQTHLLVWVDHHDDAYDWVERKRFEIHRKTGALQIFSVEEGQVKQVAGPVEVENRIPEGRLLAGWRDEDMLALGVPEQLLPSVRALRSEIELDELSRYLPDDVADGLYLVAAGYSIQEALNELGVQEPREAEAIDTEDFAAALARPETQRYFHLLEEDDDLALILEAPLEKWRVFLHPSQRRVVEWDVHGPIRVLGGAGTGKTVALIHRAKHLAREHFTTPEDRLLVTTFTRNLSADLAKQVAAITGDESARIDVKHLHGWAGDYLASQGVKLRLATNEHQREAWNAALDSADLEYPRDFYKDEWRYVVQAQDVTDRRGYLRARRKGRGTPLNGKQRAEIWRVLSDYRDHLDARGVVEAVDMIREARLHLEANTTPQTRPYAAVCADETQDFGPAELKLIRALARPGDNDLFLVGDGHQRIYGRPVTFSQCGIEIRGRSRRLRINYRTTREIRDWSVRMLEGLEVDDLDGGIDNLDGYRSLRSGVEPTVAHFDSFTEEVAFLSAQLRELFTNDVKPTEIVVAARTRRVRDEYARALSELGIPSVTIDAESGAEAGGGVRFATMHRLKGLEFRAVFLASVRDGIVPLRPSDYERWDDEHRNEHDARERALVYVTATRARDALFVTGWGDKSAL